MLSERQIIEIVNRRIPSDARRKTACFESDAERLELDGRELLLTTDEFSSEDCFPAEDGYLLGWSIAAGAITDILASGGRPRFYCHALTASSAWTEAYLGELCRGVADVLSAYEVSFAGGDVGLAGEFRCTATVIGVPGERPLSRVGARAGDAVYMTGAVGAGNLNAAIALFGGVAATRFVLRPGEARTIARHATACIDTSDGVFRAMNTIADLNGVGYAVERLPYLEAGLQFAGLLGVPEELLFLGESGEYELLFTVGPDEEARLREDARARDYEVARIGQVVPAERGRVLRRGSGEVRLDDFDTGARAFKNADEYLAALMGWVRQW
jgi:thiamine-monophosphate kinase